MMRRGSIIAMIIGIVLSGCQHHRAESNLKQERIEEKISKGMDSMEVLKILGSPNIISGDQQGQEIWTYSQVVKSSKAVAIIKRIFPIWKQKEKTRDIVIFFNDKDQVREYRYRIE